MTKAENLNDRTISYKQSAIYIRRASKRNGWINVLIRLKLSKDILELFFQKSIELFMNETACDLINDPPPLPSIPYLEEDLLTGIVGPKQERRPPKSMCNVIINS